VASHCQPTNADAPLRYVIVPGRRNFDFGFATLEVDQSHLGFAMLLSDSRLGSARYIVNPRVTDRYSRLLATASADTLAIGAPPSRLAGGAG
jgi:hypothetical protein